MSKFQVCTIAKYGRCIIQEGRMDIAFKNVECVDTLRNIRDHYAPGVTLGSIKKSLYTVSYFKLPMP